MPGILLRFICKFVFVGLVFALSISRANTEPLPKVTAKAWLVADETGNILEGTQTTEVRSIASITKLMTVMIVLDAKQPLDEVLPKKLYGKTVTRQMLIDMALVKSDNDAAKMLCEHFTGGYLECITHMNVKAERLKMYNTSFVDPTGLYNANVSTAEDLIKLVIAAKEYPEIVNASSKDHIEFPLTTKKNVHYNNTNTLVGTGINFIVTKTGWIRASGGCIVMMLETVNGIRTVILLGSKNTKTRIPEAYMLAKLF